MLINEQFRRCVTFLYAEDSDSAEKRPVGSAFFVGVDLLEETPGNAHNVYAVTAKHVIDVPAQLWVRLRADNPAGYVDHPVPPEDWERHPHTDVAVAECPFEPGNIFIRLKEFATQEFVAQHEVGEGDDVFFSGLFVGHYGRGAPQPIIRFGSVALMPHERVRVEISKHPLTFADVEAYLVEARSWGGQSGSPAFITFSADRHMGSGLHVGGLPPFALLGLVQGTWKDPRGAKAPDPSGEGIIEVNMGISTVIPAYKIVEALMSEPLVKRREELAKQVEAQQGSLVKPEAVSAVGPSENQGEFGRFEDLTRKLAKIPKKELDEKLKEEREN